MSSDDCAKHVTNPDVRPKAQRKVRQKGDFANTPPVPRSFKSPFTPDVLAPYHKGVMGYEYKGVSCLKSPIDLAIYIKLFFDKKPGTIIEIGSFHGGAALFYRDITRAYGLDTKIVTVDFRDSQFAADSVSPSGVEFIQTDALHIAGSALEARLAHLPRPWLVIEDSAHTFEVTYAVMAYFAERLETGECLIIEDGIIEDQGGNWRYDGGPNRAVHEFFVNFPDCYEILKEYNDMFGVNLSFNPNGYLVKR